MTEERYKLLMANDNESLTPEEIAEGWHFCPDWDGLLIGAEMPDEMVACGCFFEP